MQKNMFCVDTTRTFGVNRLLRVLRVSHSGSVVAYRERERQLVANFPVEIKLIIPENWQHLGGADRSASETFEVIPAKTYGTGSIPLFAYDPVTIVQALKDFQPDIVDIHEEPYSVSCFQIVQLTKKILPKSACVFYSAQNILKKYPPPFKWMEQYVYRTCDGAYPCSSGVKDVLLAKGFSTNVCTIPLGVDLSFFSPREVVRSEHGLPTDSFVVGYFGRLEHCKGIEYLMQAMNMLSPGSNWRLLLVGNGTHESVLRSFAGELKIEDKITWAGEVLMSSVPDMVSLCDLVVVPSTTTTTWKEQFGRVVVESMACGVPVIASDSGSLPEVVGSAGIVVPEKDSQVLSEKIALLANSVDFRYELRQRGLALVHQEYTWQRIANLTFELYKKSLETASLRYRQGN